MPALRPSDAEGILSGWVREHWRLYRYRFFVRTAVLDLWRVVASPPLDRCQRLYVEAAALGLLGREPYATVVREANEVWVAAVADHMVKSGTPPERSRRAVALLDAALMGFQLDLPLDAGDPVQEQAVEDLADAVAAIAASAG